MRNKSRHISALFVVLFALYSISPLSFTISDNAVAGNIASSDTAPSLAGNFRILFWELICSQFASEEDCAYPPQSERILVRKAKAVMSGNSISQLAPLEDLPDQDGLLQPDAFHTRRIFFGQDAKKPLSGVILLCSGLSPPLS